MCDFFYFKKLITNVGRPKTEASIALPLGQPCVQQQKKNTCSTQDGVHDQDPICATSTIHKHNEGGPFNANTVNLRWKSQKMNHYRTTVTMWCCWQR